jgi:TonB family protein
VLLGFVTLAAAVAGCAHRKAPLYPTHIEAPAYDRIAQAAHIEGKVVVTATIGAEGNVIDARGIGPPMLVKGAVANLKLWKFEKPRTGQRQQTIVYDYKIEDDATCEVTPPPRTSFDLPQRVEIAAEAVILCDPIGTIPAKKHR